MNLLFLIFLLILIIQRIAELFIAKHNERILFSRGAIEYDNSGYKFIVLMHACFFIAFIIEFLFLKNKLNYFSIYFFIIFVSAQILRYWSIISLREYWNTKIIILNGSKKVTKGPYRYINHPNYTAVVVEIAVVPLIFSCYYTSVFFSILNIFVLSRRIKIEQEALKNLYSIK